MDSNYIKNNYNLNPKRGFIIEKFQPTTKKDVDLIKLILEENDEVVIGIGNAGYSHEIGEIMTAGERIELTDHVLKSEGISPNKYILIPIENAPDATRWVSEILMLTPKWHTVYTRNFKNATMFESFKKNYHYNIQTIDEQKPEKEYFNLLAQYLKGNSAAMDELKIYIPQSAIDYLFESNLSNRINAIYNRKNSDFNITKNIAKRTLFLGGFQPFTGVYEDNNGHFSNIRLGLQNSDQIVIAIGSAQQDHTDSDPFTAGQRIDIIRHALINNGIGADQFYTIPIKDIDANACFAPKTVSLCPTFNSVIAGNDWTKQLFGEGDYNLLSVVRSTAKSDCLPISATRVRNTIKQVIQKYHSKDELVSNHTIDIIESELVPLMDRKTLDKMRALKVYDTMHFLAYAKE